MNKNSLIKITYTLLITILIMSFAHSALCPRHYELNLDDPLSKLPDGGYQFTIVSSDLTGSCELDVGQTMNFGVWIENRLINFSSLTYSGVVLTYEGGWYWLDVLLEGLDPQSAFYIEYVENLSKSNSSEKLKVFEEMSFVIDSSQSYTKLSGVIDAYWGDKAQVDSLNLQLKPNAYSLLKTKLTLANRDLQSRLRSNAVRAELSDHISSKVIPYDSRLKIVNFLNKFSLTENVIIKNQSSVGIYPDASNLEMEAYTLPNIIDYYLIIDEQVFNGASGNNFTGQNILDALNDLPVKSSSYKISLRLVDNHNSSHESNVFDLRVISEDDFLKESLSKVVSGISLNKKKFKEGEKPILFPLSLAGEYDSKFNYDCSIKSSSLSFQTKDISTDNWAGMKKAIESELNLLKYSVDPQGTGNSYSLEFEVYPKGRKDLSERKIIHFEITGVDTDQRKNLYLKVKFKDDFINKIKSGLDELSNDFEFKDFSVESYLIRYLEVYDTTTLPSGNYQKTSPSLTFSKKYFDNKSNILYLDNTNDLLNKILIFEIDDGKGKGLTKWTGVFKVETADLVGVGDSE